VLPGPAVPNSGGWVPRWLLGLGPVMLRGLLVWAILAGEPRNRSKRLLPRYFVHAGP